MQSLNCLSCVGPPQSFKGLLKVWLCLLIVIVGGNIAQGQQPTSALKTTTPTKPVQRPQSAPSPQSTPAPPSTSGATQAPMPSRTPPPPKSAATPQPGRSQPR